MPYPHHPSPITPHTLHASHPSHLTCSLHVPHILHAPHTLHTPHPSHLTCSSHLTSYTHTPHPSHFTCYSHLTHSSHLTCSSPLTPCTLHTPHSSPTPSGIVVMALAGSTSLLMNSSCSVAGQPPCSWAAALVGWQWVGPVTHRAPCSATCWLDGGWSFNSFYFY